MQMLVSFPPGNPAPVIDQATGKVILAFCRDNKEVFTIESTDNGLTWGSVVNISSVATEPEWGFVGTGPPGGIQLPSGRLVIGNTVSVMLPRILDTANYKPRCPYLHGSWM